MTEAMVVAPEITEESDLLPLKTIDPIKEAEWEGFLRTLHIWEMRRLCKRDEIVLHDRFVAGKVDLLDVYAEIAEPRDLEAAHKAHEKASKPTNPLPITD